MGSWNNCSVNQLPEFLCRSNQAKAHYFFLSPSLTVFLCSLFLYRKSENEILETCPSNCDLKKLLRKNNLDVNFCKDHRNKIEVPDPLAVEDLISSKLNNKRKFARLITQYRDIFFPILRKAWPSFFRVLQRMTKVFNVTS